MKRPAIQFYTGDWRRDEHLQACSLAAQGFWINMLCIMSDCHPYGYLTLDGATPVSVEVLAKLVGVSGRKAVYNTQRLLDELERNGVFSRDGLGMIFSRRMVRDEEEREKWRAEQQRARDKRTGKTADADPESGAQVKDSRKIPERFPKDSREIPEQFPDIRAAKSNESNKTDTDVMAKSARSSSSSASAIQEHKKNPPIVPPSGPERAAIPKRDWRAVELPAWVPSKPWGEYVEMRRLIRKPMTARAIELSVSKLDALRSSGNDPTAVLEQSITHSWQGLFELKAERQKQNGNSTENNYRRVADIVRRSGKFTDVPD